MRDSRTRLAHAIAGYYHRPERGICADAYRHLRTILEFSNPGFVFPGVAGGICLLIAMYAFQLLPVSYAGLALILLGISFMVAEAFLPSFGTLGIGGVVAFVVGSLMLIDSDMPGYGIPWPLIASVALVSVLFLVLVVGMALKARHHPIVSGREELQERKGKFWRILSTKKA